VPYEWDVFERLPPSGVGDLGPNQASAPLG